MNEQRPFRGIAEGKWVKGWYIFLRHENDRESHFIQEIDPVWISKPEYNRGWSHNIHEVIPETVGQSTGRRDKKRTKEYPEGQEIFKGDIVNWELQELYDAGEKIRTHTGKNETISWIKEHACYGCVEKKGGGYRGNGFLEAAELEVIGSIHDHLLKGANHE